MNENKTEAKEAVPGPENDQATPASPVSPTKKPFSAKKTATVNSSTTSGPLPQAVIFYRDIPGACPYGRTLSHILAWDDNDLESSHDYIQYLFPLPERSPVNPSAPLITKDVFLAFRADSPEGQALRKNLRKAFKRMLAFYGFDYIKVSTMLPGDPQHAAIKSNNHQMRFQNWVRRFDHNHLRITRIIRCLRLLGLEEEAGTFFSALYQLSRSQDYVGKISQKSLNFWQKAAMRKLWNPPEKDEGVVGTGCEFLLELGEA
ncbi:hypothetical protein MMC10_000556 [Thelotrema lepadinum]|nr:hypothetical protein [Thelotrema lepadinum]